MLAQVRQFFSQRSVLEVDTPILASTAPIATHIDVIETLFKNGQKGYLHTSPEYGMKRLLSEDSGDIYQLSHVFRDGEIGRLHNPEFMMLEWYRMGISFEGMIQETLDLIQLFTHQENFYTYSYQELFKKFTDFEYTAASQQDWIQIAKKNNLTLPDNHLKWDRDTYLHFFMGFLIEPQLKDLTVIHSYPASQAALAQIVTEDNIPIARRFEIYYQGIELANGFHELTDPIEQRNRFHQENLERQKLFKPALPIDENFLLALSKGIPDCCGVAVGFDRLMMLYLKKSSLEEVIPFSWDHV